MSLPLVEVIGLGPGGPDLVTTGTSEVVERCTVRFLRTERHPAAVVVPAASTFDHVYDTADRIEEVYPRIVEQLVAAAHEHGEVLYAVPGSPVVAEHTVELLLADDRVRTVVHPAMSFLDLTWARLGIDPVERGVRLVDGHRFATESAGQRGPALVAQCDTRFVLSEVKLSVEDPPEVEVVLLQRLGLPDEVVMRVDWSEMDRCVEPDHLTSLYLPELGETTGTRVEQLDRVMRRLRVEDPWKAAQTHESLQRYLLEETYEVVEAVDAYDADSGEGSEELCSELGDLLYQVVFHAAIAAEAGWFNLADVVAAIHDKLVRRHGHVFDDERDDSPDIAELVATWEADKRAELGRESIMDGIPVALPALARAAKVLKKADSLGLSTADPGSEPAGAADELGAALLDLVERAHRQGVDPEDALRRATDRFAGRARELEQRRSGTT